MGTNYHSYDRRNSLEDAELGQTNARTYNFSETWDILIVFNDDSQKVVKDVTNYGLCNTNTDIFWFEKNGFKNFMPRNDIKYFGHADVYSID